MVVQEFLHCALFTRVTVIILRRNGFVCDNFDDDF